VTLHRLLVDSRQTCRQRKLTTIIVAGGWSVAKLLLRTPVRAKRSGACEPLPGMAQRMRTQPEQHTEAHGPLRVHGAVDVEDHGVGRRSIHGFWQEKTGLGAGARPPQATGRRRRPSDRHDTLANHREAYA